MAVTSQLISIDYFSKFFCHWKKERKFPIFLITNLEENADKNVT